MTGWGDRGAEGAAQRRMRLACVEGRMVNGRECVCFEGAHMLYMSTVNVETRPVKEIQ